MKLDQLVIKRLNELISKADGVATTIRENELSSSLDPEKFQEWALSSLHLLKTVFGIQSVHYENFQRKYEEFNGWLADSFIECRGIIKAAKEDYEGGYIFRLKSLISAEIVDDVMDQARELLNCKYKDLACVVAGVALETTLKDICTRNGIPIGKLNKMNADLCKNGNYNIGMQKQITAWADRRNNAAHGNWDEYTAEDVNDMINGINRFVAEYL